MNASFIHTLFLSRLQIDLPERDPIWSKQNLSQTDEEYKEVIYKWVNLMSESQNEATEEMVNDIVQLEKKLSNLYFSSSHEIVNPKYLKIATLDQIDSNSMVIFIRRYHFQITLITIISSVLDTLASNHNRNFFIR